ncbi:hypothetical protein BASA81_005469 [Batrachochytrium salamandrivorans]|nr:hypothetical protein BASA81_005469 [Batrachochytrium salamandrivorans]
MQQQVREINKNPNLSAAEKAAQINQLFAQQREQMLAPSLSSSTPSTTTCKHYSRDCDIQTPCCGKFYPCRICHDEAEPSHALVRSSTMQMRCRHCGTVQPVAQQCIKPECLFQTTHYFCLPCRLWSNDARKPIYHCNKCGICRVGREQDHWHCDRCNLCYPTATMDPATHHCLASASEESCPVCAEYMHTSTRPVSLLPCGHVIHGDCLNQLHRKHIATCPKCRKSLARDDGFELALRAEIDRTPMPQEYANHQCAILCNDCEENDMVVPFHFYGMQCTKCRSFNTSIVRNIRE